MIPFIAGLFDQHETYINVSRGDLIHERPEVLSKNYVSVRFWKSSLPFSLPVISAIKTSVIHHTKLPQPAHPRVSKKIICTLTNAERCRERDMPKQPGIN